MDAGLRVLIVSTFFGVLNAQTVKFYSTEASLLLAAPNNITLSAGKRLSLVCVAWGNPQPNITWTPDAAAVPYQNVYTTNTTLNGLTYVVSILEICYTEPQFSGTYSCTAMNGVVAESLGGNSASFQVQVLSQPSCSSSYEVTSNLQYVYINREPFCIRCTLPGGVPTWYTWTINNSSAIGQPGTHILFNGSTTLLIQDPLVLLNGATDVLQVQCYDQTQLISYLVYMTLSEPPVVVESPQDTITSSNLKLSAVCVAWGKPLPIITWTSSHVDITSFDTYNTTVTVGQYTYVVSILEICPTLFTTSDTYTCATSNSNGGTSLGVATSSFVLQVPTTPSTVQVVEDTDLQVPCSLVGNSSVVITSLYWTDPLGSVVSNNSTLLVFGIQRNQSGVYTCTVQTASSSSISSTTVIVMYPPSVFTIGEQRRNLTRGSTATLSCSFFGLPIPSIMWSGPSGQRIESNSQFTIVSSNNFTQLNIASVNRNDAGNYTCIASNDLGNSSISIAVYIIPVPNAPIIISLYAINSTQLSLRWMVTMGATMAPADSWIVEYTPVGGSPMNMTVPGSLRMFTLTGLSRGTQYMVRVAGMNVAGLGNFSSYVENTTMVDAPSIPEVQSVFTINSTAIFVNWTTPLDNGGRSIQYYMIQIRVLGGGGPFTSVGTVLALHYVITAGVQDGTTYEVQVIASNGGTFSGPSLIEVTTPPIGPPFPLNVMPEVSGVTDTTAIVTWVSPGGYIDNYTLQYKPSDESWNGSTTNTIEATATNYTITGLMTNTTYDIQVRTNNKNSSSAFVAQSFITQTPAMVTVMGPVSAVPAGSTVTLTCVVESGYNSTVSWSRLDGTSLPPGASARGNLLLFTSVQVQHSGVYVCTFAGSAGPVSEAFSLNVSDATPLQTSSQLPYASDATSLQTESQLPSATITPPSTSIPLQLVIGVSVGAGILLLCFALVFVTCVVVLCIKLAKSPYKVENPLYDRKPESLSLKRVGSTIAEAPLVVKNINDAYMY